MAKRQGKLKDIHIKELSLVDLPANKLPFLFFKREGDVDPVNKKKKIEIGIVSDGTVGGTAVSVNGKKLGKLKSFDFSFYGGGDPKSMIHASYTKAASDSDGFSRTETYYLNKGDVMKDSTVKALQEYLGTDEIDFEKKASEEDIEKALLLITKEYKESFPEDLENAIMLIAKSAVVGCNVEGFLKDDLEKAGAKFSKDALQKLKNVLAAVEALKSILPDNKDAKEKSDISNTSAVDTLCKSITQLNESIGKIDDKKEESVASKLAETLEGLSKRLKSIEDGGVTKKSLEGDETGAANDSKGAGAGEDGKHLWPTITGQG